MMLRQITIIWIGVVAAATLSMIFCQLFDLSSLAVASKMTASTAFVAVAVTSGALRSLYGKMVLLALLLSWVGDLLLAGASKTLFLYGLGSFLLAHIAFATAFSLHGIQRSRALIVLVPIALTSVGVSLWLSNYVPADMSIPVRVYTLVISVMVIAAFSSRKPGMTTLVPTGALLFYFSDLSVATAQFVPTDFPHYVWGLPLYFTGQTLLALSVGTLNER